MSMEISGTSNTYFVGTDVTPYGCSRDGVAAVPYTIKITRFFHIENCCNDMLGYHNGTGSFIKIFTAWVDNPKYANGDCIIVEPPRYTKEQLIEFRKTDDPHIFGYKDDKGYPIIWPIPTFQADLSDKDFYSINIFKQP